MNTSQKIDRLTSLVHAATPLRGRPMRALNPAFEKWRHDVIALLEHAAPRRAQEFRGRIFTIKVARDEKHRQAVFDNAVQLAQAFLLSVTEELALYPGDVPSSAPIALSRVLEICRHFPRAARQLQQRHASRPGIEQKDEYDAQDVLHAFLLLHFADVRTEEWTPSYAGSSARIDIVLPAERTVIEVKRTRDGLTNKKCKEELAIDIDHYRVQKDSGTLVCFVFDPDHRIKNPVGFEKDLEGQRTDTLDVRVVVAPHG